MPLYEVEQYELHSVTYRVRAGDEAEAIAWVLKGNAMMIDNSQELIEVCDDRGLPVDQHQDLARRLRKLGVAVEDVIPSIRRIEAD